MQRICQSTSKAKKCGSISIQICSSNHTDSADGGPEVSNSSVLLLMPELTSLLEIGWTLQELIAPSDIIFFDCSWHYITTRVALRSKISWWTVIALSVFYIDSMQHHSTLSRFSALERLTWVSKRETTRPEDKTYSMMVGYHPTHRMASLLIELNSGYLWCQHADSVR